MFKSFPGYRISGRNTTGRPISGRACVRWMEHVVLVLESRAHKGEESYLPEPHPAQPALVKFPKKGRRDGVGRVGGRVLTSQGLPSCSQES